MKMININVGNNTLQVEKGTSVQRLIELMENNNWNPADWTITYVFPEELPVIPSRFQTELPARPGVAYTTFTTVNVKNK